MLSEVIQSMLSLLHRGGGNQRWDVKIWGQDERMLLSLTCPLDSSCISVRHGGTCLTCLYDWHSKAEAGGLKVEGKPAWAPWWDTIFIRNRQCSLVVEGLPRACKLLYLILNSTKVISLPFQFSNTHTSQQELSRAFWFPSKMILGKWDNSVDKSY